MKVYFTNYRGMYHSYVLYDIFRGTLVQDFDFIKEDANKIKQKLTKQFSKENIDIIIDGDRYRGNMVVKAKKLFNIGVKFKHKEDEAFFILLSNDGIDI